MPDKPKRKYPLTRSRVVSAVSRAMIGLDSPGFCLACGAEQDGCEPDARQLACDECSALQVYGAEEILLMTA